MNRNLIILVVIALIVFCGVLVYLNKTQVSREFHPITPSITVQNTAEQSASTNSSVQDPASEQSSPTNSSLASYSLEIPSNKLSAPIIFNVDGNNQEEYLKALEGGVAHLAKSALPGEAGNTVIFGHSSYYTNKPGNYKTIFASLDKISIGEQIFLKNTDKTFNYKITDKKIVEPKEVSIVSQDTTQHILTIITCWPVGTTNSRYIIVAKLE